MEKRLELTLAHTKQRVVWYSKVSGQGRSPSNEDLGESSYHLLPLSINITLCFLGHLLYITFCLLVFNFLYIVLNVISLLDLNRLQITVKGIAYLDTPCV